MRIPKLIQRLDAWLVGLLAASFGFRLFLVSLPRVMRWDEPAYLLLGRAIWRGQGFRLDGLPELHYPPLFPFLFGASDRVLGNGEWATDFWFLLAGTALVYIVYRFTAELYDVHVARIAALLVAFFPGLSTAVLYWGTMTEPVFALLIYGAFWVGWRATHEGSLKLFAVAGGLLALAYLGRPEAVGWCVTLAAACVVARALEGRGANGSRALSRSVSGGVILAIVFVALSSPYLIYLHRHTGRWVLSTKPGITWKIGSAVLHHNPADYDRIVATLARPGGEPEWYSANRFEKRDVGVGVPGAKALAHRAFLNLKSLAARAFKEQAFPIYLVPFLLVGLWPSRCKDHWKRTLFLLAAIAPVLAFLAFHVQQRFFAPAFPALLIGVALGLDRAGDWAEKRLSWRGIMATRGRVSMIATAMVLVFLAVGHAHVIGAKLPELDFAHKQVGLWLRSHSPKGARVLSLDEAVAAYGRRPWIPSPRAPYPEFLAYARRKGASYIVVDEFEVTKVRPFLAFLLDTAHPPRELTPVMTARDHNGETVVFALKSKAATRSRGGARHLAGGESPN